MRKSCVNIDNCWRDSSHHCEGRQHRETFARVGNMNEALEIPLSTLHLIREHDRDLPAPRTGEFDE